MWIRRDKIKDKIREDEGKDESGIKVEGSGEVKRWGKEKSWKKCKY